MAETESPSWTKWLARLKALNLRAILLPSDPTDSHQGLAVFLSLVISFLIWFTVSMRQPYTVTVELPVRLINVPDGRALRMTPPRSVYVQVRGEGWLLLGLYSNPEPLVLDVSEEVVQIEDQVNQMLLELNVITVQPSELRIPLDTKVRRVLPVRFTGTVRPGAQYDTLRAPWIEPDSVAVIGAASLVDQFSEWETVPVVLEDVREDASVEVALVDTLAELITLNPPATTLHVDVEQFTELTRTVEVRVVDKPSPDTQVTLNPDRITVRFSVPLSQYDEAETTDSLYFYVPYDQIYYDDNTGAVEPLLHLPERLKIRNVFYTTTRLEYFTLFE